MEKNGKLMENEKQGFRGQKSYFHLKVIKSETLRSEGAKIMAAILARSVGVCQPNR